MSGTRLEIATGDGVAPAFLFGVAEAPPVLLLMDGVGLRPALHELAEEIAAGGFRVLLPDLYYRLGPYEAPDARRVFDDPEARAAWSARQLASGLTPEGMVRDVGAFLEHLGDRPVGVTGYCMGGRLALVAAATYPARVAAAAAYHPGGLVTDGPGSPHLRLGAIRARVYVAAATDDPSLTPEQRDTVARALADGGVDHVLEVYPARHGFALADTPAYDAGAARRHLETLFALLRATL